MLASEISGPVAVIGDVHGQTEKLTSILNQLDDRPELKNGWVVFIGDLVDRGPDTKGTLDAVAQLLNAGRKTTVVAGNHELAMAAALGLIETPAYADWSSRWLGSFGAEATFASYGIPFGDCQALRRALPEEHVAILIGAPWSVEHRDYFFVHAGLDPHMPFRAQKAILQQRDYSLNSPGWLFSKKWPFEAVPSDCDKVVVSGHVPVPSVLLEKQKILVDTTGGVEGDLSCVLLPQRTVITSKGEVEKKSFLRMPGFFGRKKAAT
jgi:serine/threonine protein phosphatase 1